MRAIRWLSLTCLLWIASSLTPASAQNWQLMSGAARDVGVGANGTVWVIGNNAVAGGYGIYRRDGANWTNIPGGAVRIAVDPQGNAWVVNSSQNIFRYTGSQWVMVNGAATDIGVGANGTVWVIGRVAEAGGYEIFKSTDQGANWTKVPGSALRISVDPAGNAWVVNNANTIFRHDGNQWTAMPGAAKDVGVGSDGAVWVIGTDLGIYKWDGSNWTKKTGGAEQIAAGPNGVVWVVNTGNQIYSAQEQTTLAAGQTITLQGTTSVAVAPMTTGTSGSGSVTGGTLVTSANPVPGVSGAAPLVVTGLAPTYNAGVLPQGRLLCPIIEAGMKLTRGCQLGNPEPNRTSGAATYLGVAKGDPCPDRFRDDGDYCAKPDAYGRGAGYAWQFGDAAFDSGGQWSRCRAANSQGCEQPGGGITLVYPKCQNGFHAVGTNICSPDCPSGWEDIGVSCKKPNNVGNCKAYGRVAGLGYAFHDPRNGGECWACPVLMHRTMSPVTSTDTNLPACTTGNDDGIMWVSAQYPEPGLAAFVGNGDIVRLALSDRAYVDAYLNKRAASTQMSKQQLWDKMINTPNDSPELKALVFAAMMAVAQADPNLTSNAGGAVSLFQGYVQTRRTYVAQDATAMYHAYEGFNAYKQWKGAQSTMAAGGPLGFMSAGTGAIIMSPSGGLGSTVGVPPDDYVNAAQAAAVPDARGQAFIKALNDLATVPYTNPSLGTTVANPLSGMQLGLNIASSSKAFYDMLTGMRVVSEIAALGGRVGAGLDLGMSLGGSVLDAIGAVMSVFAQQEAAAQYASLVTVANKPVNIKTILTSGSDDDKNSLIAWWALATSGYQAGPTEGQNATTDAQVCTTYPAQCAAMKQIATASRT